MKAVILNFFNTLRVEEKDSLSAITIVMPRFTESEATAGKLVGDKGDMIKDSDRRDVSTEFLRYVISCSVQIEQAVGLLNRVMSGEVCMS